MADACGLSARRADRQRGRIIWAVKTQSDKGRCGACRHNRRFPERVIPGGRRHDGKVGLERAAHEPPRLWRPIPHLAEIEGAEPALKGFWPVTVDNPIARLARSGAAGWGSKARLPERQ